MVVGWYLWYNRNNFFHNGKCFMTGPLVSICSKFNKDYVVANIMGSSGSATSRPGWVPSCAGCLKLNTDAGWDRATSDASCGVVVRDSQGEVVSSASQKYKLVQDVLKAELLAVFLGVKLAVDTGLKIEVVECDSLLVVHEINKREGSLLEWFGLL